MTNDDLGVNVGEFASRVLEEELPLDGVDCGKHVHKQDGEPQEKYRAVLLEQDVPVGNEELQLTKQPESQREQQGDRYDEGIGNHGSFSEVIETEVPRLFRERDSGRGAGGKP